MRNLKLLIFLFGLTSFGGCLQTIQPTPTSPDESIIFENKRSKSQEFATPEMVKKFSEETSGTYLVGPGDVLSLSVWKRPDISDIKIVVGGNGQINVARIGFVRVISRELDDIQNEIVNRLKKFYENPEVTLRLEEQNNNRAFVLGRVSNPGETKLPINANLLQVLALAGGLPVLDKRKAPLTECIITRGEQRIRIDLKGLLEEGNMAFNARIQNNDTIFIPESGESEHIFVIGEIKRPGIVRLTSGMTFLDALMMSGGPLKSADLEKTFVIRMGNTKGAIRQVNLKAMLETANSNQNFLLKNGDVIFTARSGISKFQEFLGYVIKIMTGVNLGLDIAEKTGLMQNLRETWWGQEGFVGD